VTEHPEVLAQTLLFMLERVEKGVSEVSLVNRTSVGLDVVPQVVIRHLEDPRKELEQTTVYRSGEVVGESGDLVHERVDARWDSLEGFELIVVKIELTDTIRLSLDSLGVSEGPSRRLTLQP
jgi:hypothetical protein